MNENGDDDYVSNIRIKAKEDLNKKREKYRRCAIDQFRGISNKSNIIKLGEKLKSKQHVDESTLSSLQNALLESEENIVSFLKVEGALSGLIKELSGTESSKQLLAAKCCCNISLGPSRACMILATQASVYLITYLNSSNSHLVELCCWTLGNMMAGSDKIISHLEHQGIIPKLCGLLNKNQEKAIINAASYALSHYLSNNYNPPSLEELKKINDAIQKIYSISDDTIWLFQTFSAKITPEMLNNEIIMNLLEKLINTVFEKNWEQNLSTLNCIIRILANCHSFPCEFLYFNDRFFNVMTILISSQYIDLSRETVWFLGNLFNNAHDSMSKILFFEKMSPLLLAFEKSQMAS